MFEAHSLDHSSIEQLALEADLHRALLQHEFIIHYQPIFSMNNKISKGLGLTSISEGGKQRSTQFLKKSCLRFSARVSL